MFLQILDTTLRDGAQGAGVDIAEVNRLVKQFDQAKKMMKQMPGMMGGKRGKRGMFKGLPF